MARTSAALGLALPLAVFAVITALVIARPGFTPDEEITAVAATAIGTRGVPLLPSGVFYPRGVPYLYAAWLTSLVAGQTMLGWRLASWIFGAIGIVVSHRLGARLGGPVASFVLPLLLASFPPYVAASVFARSYSALIAAALLFVYWLLCRIQSRGGSTTASAEIRALARSTWKLSAALAFAVWMHPAGIVLAALPALIAFAHGASRQEGAAPGRPQIGRQDADRMVGWPAAWRLTGVLLPVGCAAAAMSYGAHAVSLWSAGVTPTSATALYAIPTPAPPGSAHITSAATLLAWVAAVAVFAGLGFLLLRRHPGSTALTAASLACAVSDQLGMLLLVGLVALVWNPREAKSTVVVVVAAGLTAVAFWTLHTALVSHAQVTLPLVRSLTTAAASYPLGQFRFAMGAFRALSALALVAVAWSLSRPAPDEVQRLIGALALLFTGTLVAFTMMSVPVAERYLILPWTLLLVLASVGVTVVTAAVVHRRGPSSASPVDGHLRPATVAVAAGLAALLWLGHVPYLKDRDAIVPVPIAQQAFAPPTGPSWMPELVRPLVEPRDLIICTEELACVYLLGRVDFLFALPPRDVAHYVVDRRGDAAGFYAGAPVVSSRADLQRAIQGHDATGCASLVTLKSGKVGYGEYLAVLDELRESFDVHDVLSREEMHVHRVCRSIVNARLMPRRLP